MKNLFFLFTLSFGIFMTSCSDPCKDISCNEVGTCDDGTCICDTGYEGANCETESREKFIGTWESDSPTCNDMPATFLSLSIEKGEGILDLNYIFKDSPELKIPAVLENNNLKTIDNIVDLDGDEITINSNLSLTDNNLLNFDYQVSYQGITYHCTALLTKI